MYYFPEFLQFSLNIIDPLLTSVCPTIKLALQMWCLMTPPPRIIIPVLTAYTAWLFIRRMSEKG